ncbi:MFS transporter [Pseudogulbenkiania ferrooxidans]|uniref:Major facilitator superfamily MFS_1 n=1 Tax=Pseudogulbenkiania ferrooxidans 2002 TaxID=279714 RepID=B9Z655_9NEIS|nr:MFS transporter [Pseudogulbenkiania ferrooxidans]EEG07699.1 major facilitator superfamily MFS_1 [Pseudogulbenkiania ferrooxidans 2002]
MSSLDPHHRRAITLLSCAAFASSASARLCDPMLPNLAKAFLATPADAAQVVSSFSVAYGLMQLFFGPLGDRFGKYRMIAWTTLASLVGSLGAALSYSLGWLVLARLLTGVTAAGIIPLSMAWIGDTVPYEQRQATLARFLGGQIMGVIGGQFIGGLFTDTLGWRWAFAALALVYLLVGWRVLAESRANPLARPTPAPAGHTLGVLAQGRTVIGVGWARVILLTVFLEGIVVFGALAFVPSYLHQRFGLSLTMAGALMAFFGVGGLSYILFARHFVRRFGEVGLAAGGGVLIGGAWLLLALGDAWAWAIPASYLVGLGYYMMHNTLQTNATQMAPQVRGTAVSLFASAFFLGQSLGVVLAAALLARSGATTVFIAAAAITPVLGTVFARRIRLQHRRLQTAQAS